MTPRKKAPRPRARRPDRQPGGEEQVRDLPKREAMSLIRAIPLAPVDPTMVGTSDYLGGGTTTPPADLQSGTVDTVMNDPSVADATTEVTTVEQNEPLNDATATNVGSTGTTEEATATQDTSAT